MDVLVRLKREENIDSEIQKEIESNELIDERKEKNG